MLLYYEDIMLKRQKNSLNILAIEASIFINKVRLKVYKLFRVILSICGARRKYR